jgi:hypothetical protein
MEIKTTVVETTVKNTKVYPYIGVSDSGTVVLFSALCRGTLLAQGGTNPIGYNSDIWMERNFTPLRGSITLTQE